MGRDTCVREGTAGKMASGRVGVLVCVTYVCNSIWAYSCIWDLRVRVRKVYVKEACVPLCVCMCVCGEGLWGCICLDSPQVLGLPGRTILAPIPFSPLTDLFKLSASAFPPFLCFMISIIPPHCPPLSQATCSLYQQSGGDSTIEKGSAEWSGNNLRANKMSA